MTQEGICPLHLTDSRARLSRSGRVSMSRRQKGCVISKSQRALPSDSRLLYCRHASRTDRTRSRAQQACALATDSLATGTSLS